MVSRARPGRGAGQCEVEGPWRVTKQPGGNQRLRFGTRGSPRLRMPRAKRALATLGEGAGGGGAS